MADKAADIYVLVPRVHITASSYIELRQRFCHTQYSFPFITTDTLNSVLHAMSEWGSISKAALCWLESIFLR